MELLEKLHIEWPLLIAQIVNFLILLVILGRFVYKPILRLLEQRRTIIAQSLEKSELMEQKFAEFQEDRARDLAKTRTEAQVIIEQSKRTAEEERQKIQQHTKAEIDAMIARAEQEIGRRKEAMLAEAQKDIKALLVPALERILREAVDEESQKRILARAAEQIRAMNNEQRTMNNTK